MNTNKIKMLGTPRKLIAIAIVVTVIFTSFKMKEASDLKVDVQNIIEAVKVQTSKVPPRTISIEASFLSPESTYTL